MTKKKMKDKFQEYELKFFDKLPSPLKLVYMFIRFGTKEIVILGLTIILIMLVWKFGYSGERLNFKSWGAPYQHGQEK